MKTMRVIDCHTHYYPDHIAENVLEILASSAFPASLDGTRAELERSMSENGISLALNLPVATDPDQVEGINRRMIEDNRAPIYCLGAIHPNYPDAKNMVRYLGDNGIKGVKVHPEYQSFNPLEARAASIWEACCEFDMIVYFHAGYDVMFKPPYKSNPMVFAELKRRYPSLKAVLGHFGSLDMWDDVDRYLSDTDYYFDTGYILGYIDRERFLRLARNHGFDKVVFATDSPWQCQKRYIETFTSWLEVERERELFFHGNAEKLFGFGPEAA